MFALFGLAFLFVKVAIQSFVYGSAAFAILYLANKITNSGLLQKLMKWWFVTWPTITLVTFISLIVYAFSFWGYSGLGDYFCIPVGNGYRVASIDDMSSAWFGPDKGPYSRQADIQNFSIKNRVICAAFKGFNSYDCNNCYIVFDTRTEKMQVFNSSTEYSNFAAKNKLPQVEEFKSFDVQYGAHWGGIRWFLLP